MPTVNLTRVICRKGPIYRQARGLFRRFPPRFLAARNANGKKTWCVSYRFGGKWTRYTFGTFSVTKLAEARETARDALHDVAHGINPATKKKADRDADTFRYFAHEYLERHAKPKKKSWQGMIGSSTSISTLSLAALMQKTS
jgi:hypothetical protein